MHHQVLLRDLGLLPINRVTAAKANPKSPRRAERRVEKSARIEETAPSPCTANPSHGTPDDAARKFNRTENVRAIPCSDPDFARLYPRRNDSESINRNLEDTLWLGRAHSIGHARQLLNLLGYASW